LKPSVEIGTAGFFFFRRSRAVDPDGEISITVLMNLPISVALLSD
jgi:hypothetical protein